jgi:hypothetical protein
VSVRGCARWQRKQQRRASTAVSTIASITRWGYESAGRSARSPYGRSEWTNIQSSCRKQEPAGSLSAGLVKWASAVARPPPNYRPVLKAKDGKCTSSYSGTCGAFKIQAPTQTRGAGVTVIRDGSAADLVPKERDCVTVEARPGRTRAQLAYASLVTSNRQRRLSTVCICPSGSTVTPPVLLMIPSERIDAIAESCQITADIFNGGFVAADLFGVDAQKKCNVSTGQDAPRTAQDQ